MLSKKIVAEAGFFISVSLRRSAKIKFLIGLMFLSLLGVSSSGSSFILNRYNGLFDMKNFVVGRNLDEKLILWR